MSTSAVEITSPPSPILFDSALRSTTREVASALGEQDWRCLGRIRSIARYLGRPRCLELVAEAIATQAAGTCLRNDGQPRTLGGCWFRLAFDAIHPDLRVQIYGRGQYNIAKATGPRAVKAAVPQPPVVTEWDGTMSTAKLEVALKVNELPRGAFTVQDGAQRFYLDCGGRTVTVTLRPKAWKKLVAAAKDWPEWTASISGKMGAATPKGFELDEPNVQVFEKKPKAPASVAQPVG